MHLCRICFDAQYLKKVKFEADGEWARLLEYCVGFPVLFEESTPLVFCGICAKKLQEYSRFKRQCIKSEALWKSKTCQLKCTNQESTLPTSTSEVKVEEWLEPDIFDDIEPCTNLFTNNDVDDDNLCKTDQLEFREETIKNLCKNEYPDSSQKKQSTTSSSVKEKIKKIRTKQTITGPRRQTLRQTVKPIKYQSDSGDKHERVPKKSVKKYYEEIFVTKGEEGTLSASQTKLKQFAALLQLKKNHFNEMHNNINTKDIADKYYKEIFVTEQEGSTRIAHDKKKKIPRKPWRIEPIKRESNENNVTKKDDDIFYDEIIVQAQHVENTNVSTVPVTVKPIRTKESYDCFNCGKVYNKIRLQKHLVQCTGLGTAPLVKCNKCGEMYDSKKSEHLERCSAAKPVSSLFYCGLCELTSPDSERVRLHFIDIHYAESDMECKLCDYVGRDLGDMVGHRYEHHPKEFAHTFKCPLCPKRKFTSQYILKVQFHFRKEHLKKKGGLCSICGKSFGTYKSFRTHYKLHSIENVKYICDCCGLRFINRYSIVKHIVEHQRLKQCLCPACGLTFTRLSNLKSHIANIHTQTKRVRCTHCNRMYKNEKWLQKHLQQVKAGCPHVCHICFKGFYTSMILKRHMVTHSDARPFSCKECERTFKYKAHVIVHMRSHTGIKRHKCSYCDKSFITSHQLERHVSVHTGVRQYKCPLCNESFHLLWKMNAHYSSAHSDEVKKNLPAVTEW